jgi:hypothetical protein
MDKRKLNGSKKGENRNAGRKPKATEIQIIEQLTPLDKIALSALEKGLKSGELGFVKLFLEYRFGKPKQMQEITLNNNSTNDLVINVVRDEPKIRLPDGQEISL